MSIATISNITPETINISGAFTTVFLIIAISISLLLVDSKYWNRYISNVLDIYSYSILVVFIEIVIFNIVTVM